ncbi:TIGR03767 family metallophosphoesterase [Streptomyces sp. NBC_01387]|uniref:TIGR03767 family metallophosphoesterase n=1 Tax=unclassified Streptomyces TaxID=2593676 RepID=UPI002023F780|nr:MULTISPECIES: TIGR03767 family metallophosphoesterase [unclassified Streptomyces]WSC22492.1 TIGR03767 family metallophosphoesterase [Streptomyces sp. NBC_01766]WSV56334.1 TIGR03767 family metallophosphoesterase [Streptomyces sp. NBC_01014]
MSRIRSAAAALDRRTFLVATGAVGVSAGAAAALGTGSGASAAPAPAEAPAPAVPAAARRAPAPAAPSGAGTTLLTAATPRTGHPGSGYRRLGDGPGWARVVRPQLAAPRAGRATRRTVLSAFVQLTDLHLTDVQHPVRGEFLRPADPAAWRPQEALTVPGAVSLIERVNALRGGPATGEPLAFVMTTGDNTDNNSRAELDWFLKVMSGGRITPDTGDPHRYEGVQASGLRQFWHPDAALRDMDKQRGFPHIEGFLAAAVRSVNSPGLRMPWYSTVGNHDSLTSGSMAPRGRFLADFAVGGRKLYEIPQAEARAQLAADQRNGDYDGSHFAALMRRHAKNLRPVTPDETRAPFTPREYLTAHLDPAHAGAGPVGHGYTRADLDSGTLYYTFRIADGVLGVSLDTTGRGGHFTGTLGTTQLRWLERTLKDHADDHVIVFSHHNSWTITNTHPDPAHPGDGHHSGEEVVALLKRHRNALAWINGHSHRNKIQPHGSFWEITTASHIDFPQLARVFELVDNKDGTLSLFTTLVESAAPHRTDFTDLSQTGLAALYRELSSNAPGARTDLSGGAGDRNTELVLKKR